MTYFHHPTGRCSDGRLIVDFLAQAMGLPLLRPALRGGDFRQGANFAMAGATAVANSFFKKMGIQTAWINNSLPIQIQGFKELLLSLCPNTNVSDNRPDYLSTSLFVVGEIGGNDYLFSLTSGKKLEEVRSFVPRIIRTISNAVQGLIEAGARTVMVPGNLPMGCIPVFLTYFSESGEEDHDASTGCIDWLNDFSGHHNRLLQEELHRLRRRYPDATIIYADYYNATMSLYRSPHRFGFSRSLVACCGGGGRYNYNPSAECGSPTTTVCEDPSTYVSWDGKHMTEAAYKIVADGLLEGLYTSPGRLAINGQCRYQLKAMTSRSSSCLHEIVRSYM